MSDLSKWTISVGEGAAYALESGYLSCSIGSGATNNSFVRLLKTASKYHDTIEIEFDFYLASISLLDNQSVSVVRVARHGINNSVCLKMVGSKGSTEFKFQRDSFGTIQTMASIPQEIMSTSLETESGTVILLAYLLMIVKVT